MISQLIDHTFTDLSQYDVCLFLLLFFCYAELHDTAGLEPAVHSNPNTFSANRWSLCWLCTPFLCNWLFSPTCRTSQLSLSGCIYPLLIQSTHLAPAELQTNTALSTGAMLSSALPFQEALNILIFRTHFVFRWHILPRVLASQDG